MRFANGRRPSQKLYAAAPACATARRVAATLVDPDAWELEAERLRKLLEDQPLFAAAAELLERLRAAHARVGERARGGRARLHDLEPVARNPRTPGSTASSSASTRATAATSMHCSPTPSAPVRRPSRGDAQLAVRQGLACRQESRLSNGAPLSNLFSLPHEQHHQARARRLETQGQQALPPAGRQYRLDHPDPQLEHRLEVRRDRRRRGEPGRHDGGAAAPLYGQEGDRRGRRPPGDTALRGRERGPPSTAALRPSS